MSLDLHLSLSLSPPAPTPTPSPSPEPVVELQEPPTKRRKLNTLKTENTNYHNPANNTNNNNIKDGSLSHPPRRKRKLPSFVCAKSLSTRRARNTCNNNSKTRSMTQENRNRKIQHRQRRIRTQNRDNNHNEQCKNKPQIYDNDDNISFKWNNIAITSLTTIFEYINTKFLYMNVCLVCKYWYSTIAGKNSDFIFGFFRKTMHANPLQPLTLTQLKSYNVPYIKQELKSRSLKLNGKKSELVQRLYQSIKNDSLPQNINNRTSIMNRKRLILFQIQQIHRNDLFCQNCHIDWNEYFKLNKKSLSKKDIMKQLTSIHMGLKICRKCQNLKEFQDINMEHALRYYGLNQNDFIKCGIKLKHGKGQMVHVITTFDDEYTNAYVCQQIAKMKYSKKFKRRTVDQEKKLADKARGLLQKGQNDKYIEIYAPNIDYNVDENRFEFDEILYNATQT